MKLLNFNLHNEKIEKVLDTQENAGYYISEPESHMRNVTGEETELKTGVSRLAEVTNIHRKIFPNRYSYSNCVRVRYSIQNFQTLKLMFSIKQK